MIDTRSPVLESMIVEERVSEKEKGHKALLKQFLQGAPDYFPLGNMVLAGSEIPVSIRQIPARISLE